MSEFYNHTSGSYENYLATSAEEQTAIQIRNASNKQILANAVMTAHLSNDIERVGENISNNLVRMETGIRTSISQNTYATIASAKFLQQTFQNGFDSVNMTLDLGFAGVNQSIGSLSASISNGFQCLSKQMEDLQNEICDRLDKIHDIVNNPILTKSRELYRRAFSNFNKGFHEEALEDIKQAVEINKTDYISWYLLGKIYLYGVSQFSNTLNIEEALKALNTAAKYITPDIIESSEAAKLASEIYYNIAFANYILGTQKLSESSAESTEAFNAAKSNASKSYQYSNDMLESLYLQSRCEALENNKEAALKIVDSLIDKDGLYSLRYLSDPDFKELYEDIEKLVESKRQALYDEVYKEIEFLQNIKDYFEFSETPFSTAILKELENVKPLGTQYLDLLLYKNNYSYLYSMFKEEDFPCDRIVCYKDYGRYESGEKQLNMGSFISNEIRFDGIGFVTRWYGADNFLPKNEISRPFAYWRDDNDDKYRDGLYFNGTELKSFSSDVSFGTPTKVLNCDNFNSDSETQEDFKDPLFDFQSEYYTTLKNPQNSWDLHYYYSFGKASEHYLQSKKYKKNNLIFFNSEYDINYKELEHNLDYRWSYFYINAYTLLIHWSGFEDDCISCYPQYFILQPSIRSKKSIEDEKSQIEEFNKLRDNQIIEYQRKEEEERIEASKKKSGCYVATAVYGSYDCPQVWTLRRFRDNTLAETWYGRLFIHTYYAISPTLVKWFGDTSWFKKMWKGKLDKMVNKLNSEGVENTPYKDKIW